jgi:cation transport regulator ChaC
MADSSREQNESATVATDYLFGYGSLIQRESRESTWPSAAEAFPVEVSGVLRGWFDRVPTLGPSTTYLGAMLKRGARCNGVAFAVSRAELEAYDARETGYVRERIKPRRLRLLDGRESLPSGSRIWFYASKHARPASRSHPIVQSYVDVCVSGCIEIERRFPFAERACFAEAFVRTCSGWRLDRWVNDRVHPRRPFAAFAMAGDVDRTLAAVLGRRAVDSVPIEGAGEGTKQRKTEAVRKEAERSDRKGRRGLKEVKRVVAGTN